MVTEIFSANRATTTVPFGGTDAPAGRDGRSHGRSLHPLVSRAAATGVSQFHVADPALPTEIIAVTNVSGTTWTVTRGAESTTPVAHSAGFTVSQVVTTGFLGNTAALTGAKFTGYTAPAVVPLTFGTAITVNAALGNAFALTLTASTGVLQNPGNPVDGQLIRFRITQGTAAPLTVAFNSAYNFGSGGDQGLSTAAGDVDIIGFEYVAALSSGASWVRARVLTMSRILMGKITSYTQIGH